ncbi:MAG: DUF3301 domain-containing protein [Gammaproteobacteria bacterium]|nr:DUF3301 domain-containing protein [Gammaproteobacteria bacterium]NND40077.1 DUF3301 domain-containing protein [Pseudomonadales bacterium]MBT8150134.1 DUF3301 domain-containing protein [Gammaproteobacteria bacterium]NNL11299.1 DUF3301 domain-containing protein [Pseudomonadales bacterium]NNM10939.1 DUF3301 domain-containing protein [Pseudomonadales bacterium]
MFLIKILLIFLAVAAALYFYSALRVRELATVAARKRCTELGVQFLDQSVSANGIALRSSVAASTTSKRTLERRYRFEFTSTGDERYVGLVTMLGNRVSAIELEPHRMPDDV